MVGSFVLCFELIVLVAPTGFQYLAVTFDFLT